MAKKGYPGLVLVPPSDRTILRRRLLRWALLIIALIWCASTLPLWPPVPDDREICQPGVGQEGSNSPAENCGQLQRATEPPPQQSEFSLMPVSQAEGLGESRNPPPSPTPDPDRSATQNDRDRDSQPKSSDPTDRLSSHNVTPSGNEKSASSLPAAKPVQHPDGDVRLAEQGDAFAQYRLGRYYAQRDGPRTPESVSWYRKASLGLHRLAETGNGQAMYVLGVMYAYGRGVARDTEQARRWLTQAIDRKVTAAQPVLANLQVQPSTDPKSKVNEEGKR
ncbi:MAG TPA: tetratricopeptide repeat protein [Nitrospira sp.]|nr:tetratricopeptide repeat protein [Nitrospira sp.]